ncbi:hypothetical protein A3A18_01530 [Candidatus Azambacteria bacterium RIFCSPLOWO2_01_FULL_44_84]|uniref:Membrane insertase YidC/Oxa/ALB C-terminal domain-containing protein n=1 Tax=Candidatus Azambacteria bacterium RIFCSPLOWO2_02_FULL_44_14 TaxID=1797306 RepID=A0A1F5CB82_9BACT|nr:MAG: hypothetical protein A3A18_01530 [Candidatus Azambacteria bacterium RIFCSPLOWO2_01_FULL_44_84]OGD33023.1 MAG: hypothetical protein A3C78_01425 [Candidatus Azambacteria bacterium RIFCSPHIGHO2_02_FULL_45_18]OGD40068.1 MAG: hypothetical protein A3I30_02480 [Candidatus Azambacteria bacterium RIFCSPLOWO2_02_FULL_44_14]OGD52165.1 MAG: hypothetical protein A2608_00830 [Candidatus Azambacteria bacterium RIFOXYD1_FULL_44_10]
MINIFNEILFRPLINLLVFFYNVIPTHDVGLAIIALTVVIRLILWPLGQKGIKSQAALAKIQPEIEEIKKKYQGNKEGQAKALMELYSKNGINPLSGCLPIIIQIPVLIALWQVFLSGAKLETISGLYSFVAAPSNIQPVFLGLFDLTQRSVILAIVAGALQYFQAKMMMPTFAKASVNKPASAAGAPDFGQMMSKQMLYFAPILTIVISWSLPAALPLYWIVTTLATLAQQYWIKKRS